MRYNLLYGETVRNKDGGNETLATCILNRLKDEYNPIAAAIELAAAGGGITATAMIFEMLKLGKASTVLGRGAGYYLIAQDLRVLLALKDAGLWCQEEKCVAFVEKVITTNARSKWNPRYWLDSPTYECIACPEGSDEVFPNSDGEVWREKP